MYYQHADNERNRLSKLWESIELNEEKAVLENAFSQLFEAIAEEELVTEAEIEKTTLESNRHSMKVSLVI